MHITIHMVDTHLLYQRSGAHHTCSRRDGTALELIERAQNTTRGLMQALDEEGWIARSRDDLDDGSKRVLYTMLCI